MSLVVGKNLVREFNGQKVLNNVCIELEKNQDYTITGASGSGKSTLLYLLAGLDRPNSGELKIEGENLIHFSDQKLAKYRNTFVGLVFQFHFLLPSMNGLDNILLPSKIGSVYSSDLEKKAKSYAKDLGVEHCLEKYPYQMSGGEQQRISIIRAILLSPELLLCDEPTGNLDTRNSKIVIGLLRELAQDLENTLVVVTHNMNIKNEFSANLIMQDGKLS